MDRENRTTLLRTLLVFALTGAFVIAAFFVFQQPKMTGSFCTTGPGPQRCTQCVVGQPGNCTTCTGADHC